MIARNVTRKELEKALIEVHFLFGNNVTWNRAPESLGKGFRFTLRVKDSKKLGAGRTLRGIRSTSACWHVHGHFFEALFEINPQAVIIARSKRITKDAGNWEDYNVGSMMFPAMASGCCECA